MRLVFSILWIGLTITCIVLLNNPMGKLPAMGKLLSPFDGFWANAQEQKLPEELTLPQLKAPVRIHWDKHDIPHIVAQNDWDLYLVQGYLTAYHRLWQMSFQVRKTAGRLSEVLGKLTQESDRWQRRRGIPYAAERLLTQVKKTPATNNMFEAYAQGVNAYIESLSYADFPLEYKLLNYTPEPWSAYKSCLLIKEMADILSTGNQDIANSSLREQLGAPLFDLLFDMPEVDPFVPVDTRFDFTPVVPEENLLPLADSIALPDSADLSYPVFESPNTNTHHGSNVVVVGPQLSASGDVLLANEPDLDLGLPSLWYIVHLIQEGQSISTMGGSLPGLPGVAIGFNDSIAWGLTNANRDLVDWYAMNFVDASRKEYLYDDQYYKTERRIEHIAVRNQPAIYDTVIYTHHGPVVYDANFGYTNQANPSNLAMKWTGHLPSNDWYMMYLLNRARNYQDFKQAITHLRNPAQHVAVGTIQKDIALWVQGNYPIKRQGQGVFVQSGSASIQDWQGMIPQDQLIYRENPSEGFLSNANEQPAAREAYPYPIYWYNYENYRGRRLRERLRAMKHIRPSDLWGLQNDNFNLVAYETLPLLLDSLARETLTLEETRIYESLSGWTFFNEASSQAAIYFDLWFQQLTHDLLDEYPNWQRPKYLPSTYQIVRLLRTQPYDFELYDKQHTPQQETLQDLIQSSFKKISPQIDTWKQNHPNKTLNWSNFKNTTIRHLLRIPVFGVSNIAVGGGDNIVNAVKEHHGPSLRMVVKLSETGNSAWAIYPGSQNGHVGQPSYAQWITRWAKGNYLSLLFGSEAKVQKEAVYSHQFVPID